MTKPVSKIIALKALLGDEAAKKVVQEAELRETAAQAAGIEFKDANDKPTKLSVLLAEIDAAIESGAVEDDVNTDEDTTTPKEATPFTLEQFKEAVTGIVDTKLAAFKAELAKPPAVPDPKEVEALKTKEADELKVKLKTMEDEAKVVKDKLAELMGEQPRNAGFRASRAKETITEKETAPAGFKADPLNSFIDEVLLRGTNGNGA